MAHPPDPTAVVEFPGPWQHRYVAANGARFHVAESAPVGAPGDAPLVLLLHGFPEFWWAWRDLLPVLAGAGYRAAAMDLRGYGGSDKPPRGYDPFTLARDVVGVVKALGERSAVVVGQGWGGYVGWAAAALHPGQVAGLCAIAAPHPLVMLPLLLSAVRSPQRFGVLGHILAMQAPFVPERRLSREASSYVGDHLRSWSSPASGFPTPDVTERYQQAIGLWPAAHCALEYHRWLLRSRVRADGRRFSAVMEPPLKVPVCLVQGEDDPVASPDRAWRTAERVSASHELHVLRGAGHFVHEEAPAEVAQVVLTWLARVAPV